MHGKLIFGWQLSEKCGWAMAGAPPRDGDVVVDTTTDNAITEGPRQGSGACKAVYDWAGLAGRGKFPAEVKRSIGAPHDAEADQHADGKVLIHVVGPTARTAI